ncbi:MAG: 16S rRNA (uracil(1498)-N(3))-methyltransferase [Prevotellaceae bacterium]|nr:16S rRNA (uracil(1498)-N(3))-methyltransferase [Prevotellaceae bacterium]MDO4932121.1 16S rRNA (uracil(1498)-N(3))-methyltransferase [Prevotellaceae bacterium]
MKEERFFYVPDAACKKELPQDEAIHATRVLRLHEGDNIFLMDGKGTFYKAVVTMTSGKRCTYSIEEELPQQHPWHGHIHIVMAPTKMMERVEWMAEKATEIGINELSFIECRFSERRQLRTDRIEKIVIAAMKQSHKAWKPAVNELCPFEEFVKQKRDGSKFICHCYNEIEKKNLFNILQTQSDKDEDITILIGPEGDFSMEEVKQALQYGFQSVSLGTSRLRTETAALSAVMMAQLTRQE